MLSVTASGQSGITPFLQSPVLSQPNRPLMAQARPSALTPTVISSEFNLLRDVQSIGYLDTNISDRAFKLGVAERMKTV